LTSSGWFTSTLLYVRHFKDFPSFRAICQLTQNVTQQKSSFPKIETMRE
jgi:hypothetical protein